MSRLGLDSALWSIYTSADNTQQFSAGPVPYLDAYDLAPEERQAIVDQDWGKLLDLGAHPFLMYKTALRIAGGFSLPFLQTYLEPLQGHQLGDIVT